MIIKHQFFNSEYFFPNWKVNKLFIGTFNPICGEKLDYYYRRKSNGFWKILDRYNSQNQELKDFTFSNLKKFMINKEFGCVDVIRSVSFPKIDKDKICGNGYTDSNLFKVKEYIRDYNFEQIKEFIHKKSIKYVFTTWGNRCNPKEFGDKVMDLNNFCSHNGVVFIHLNSPSGRLYKGDKVNTINSNWWNNLDSIF
jgi:hypothetical protein